jgi:hypothetical protein
MKQFLALVSIFEPFGSNCKVVQAVRRRLLILQTSTQLLRKPRGMSSGQLKLFSLSFTFNTWQACESSSRRDCN